MIKKHLKPIFNSKDISEKLIFINCTLGYDGNINLLFVDKKYDNVKSISRIISHLDPTKKIDIGDLPIPDLKYIPASPQNYKLIILGTVNKVIEFNNQKINYSHALQIDEDKFIFFIHGLYKSLKNNAIITNSSGKITSKFTAGTGINDVQANANHEIWISYADYGKYSMFRSSIEKGGLNCFDSSGKIVYTYHHSPIIDECNSLNVISQDDIFINIYTASVNTGYALGIIENKNLSKIKEWKKSSEYMAYYDNKILVISNYLEQIKSKFKFVDIANNPEDIGEFEFFNENNEPLHCVHAQKDRLYFWKNNLLYTASIKELEV